MEWSRVHNTYYVENTKSARQLWQGHYLAKITDDMVSTKLNLPCPWLLCVRPTWTPSGRPCCPTTRPPSWGIRSRVLVIASIAMKVEHIRCQVLGVWCFHVLQVARSKYLLVLMFHSFPPLLWWILVTAELKGDLKVIGAEVVEVLHPAAHWVPEHINHHFNDWRKYWKKGIEKNISDKALHLVVKENIKRFGLCWFVEVWFRSAPKWRFKRRWNWPCCSVGDSSLLCKLILLRVAARGPWIWHPCRIRKMNFFHWTKIYLLLDDIVRFEMIWLSMSRWIGRSWLD